MGNPEFQLGAGRLWLCLCGRMRCLFLATLKLRVFTKAISYFCGGDRGLIKGVNAEIGGTGVNMFGNFNLSKLAFH